MNRPIFKRSWGYTLDYDKEIAADEKLLASLERALDAGWVKTCDPSYAYGLHDLMLDRPEIAVAFGLSDEDRACLGDALDLSAETFTARRIPNAGPDVPTGAWYRRGDDLLKRIVEAWEGDLYTAAELKKRITHAKAALARHRRNKGKHA